MYILNDGFSNVIISFLQTNGGKFRFNPNLYAVR